MQNTLLTFDQQKALVAQKLATESVNGSLITFKYARKVMFDYLWKTNPDLLECRGHTYDLTTKELVVAAPRKSFNYLEDGYWKDVPLDTPVVAYKKFNGFLACVSEHNKDIVVSTTGSTKSDYVGYAKALISPLHIQMLRNMHDTAMFEIIHPDDPHVVAENQGAHLLGTRNKSTGVFTPVIADIRLPDAYYEGTLKGILAIAELNQGEGFMVYKTEDRRRFNCCKLKTPYYVGKKKLMRMNKHQVNKMYNPEHQQNIIDSLPERWKFAVDCIQQFYTCEEWLDKTDQQRRVCLENFDNDCTK